MTHTVPMFPWKCIGFREISCMGEATNNRTESQTHIMNDKVCYAEFCTTEIPCLEKKNWVTFYEKRNSKIAPQAK